jgi:hypothetical protein
MILPLLLAAQAAAPAPDDPRLWDNPPTEMIDFLGRRRLCAELGQPDHRDASDQAAAERWRCAPLSTEERTWRARYADNAQVRAWLDLDPRRFSLNNVSIHAWHGPPRAETRRVEQNGVDARTGQSYHLVIDAGVDGGRRIRVTASFAELAPRSFTLDAAVVPFLDLQSLTVALGALPVRRDRLYVMMRYGELRGYCSLDADDDRPEVSIVFERDTIRASRLGEPVNCEAVWTDLPDAAAR